MLESSFSILQHEFSQQNDKNKQIDHKVKDSKLTTKKLISNIEDNVSYYHIFVLLFLLYFM